MRAGPARGGGVRGVPTQERPRRAAGRLWRLHSRAGDRRERCGWTRRHRSEFEGPAEQIHVHVTRRHSKYSVSRVYCTVACVLMKTGARAPRCTSRPSSKVARGALLVPIPQTRVRGWPRHQLQAAQLGCGVSPCSPGPARPWTGRNPAGRRTLTGASDASSVRIWRPRLGPLPQAWGLPEREVGCPRLGNPPGIVGTGRCFSSMLPTRHQLHRSAAAWHCNKKRENRLPSNPSVTRSSACFLNQPGSPPPPPLPSPPPRRPPDEDRGNAKTEAVSVTLPRIFVTVVTVGKNSP